MKKYFGDKAFYKMALALIIPVVIQQLILSIAGYVDNFMINGYDSVAYAGVSVANRFMFIINFFWIGIASGISIFVAQYYGAKMEKSITGTIQLGVILSIIFGLLSFFLIYYLGPITINLFFPNKTAVDLLAIGFGIEYVKIISYGSVVILLNFMVSTIYRSLGKPKVPLIAGIIGIVANIIMNFIFIFGHLGFKEMGASGAALATIISKGIELSILILIAFAFNKNSYAYKIFKGNHIKKPLLVNYLKKGAPVIANEILWAFGVTLMARFITGGNLEWIIAYGYSQNVTDLFFVYYAGMAVGTSVILGQTLGEGDFKKAKEYYYKLFGLMLISNLIAIVLMVGASPLLLHFLADNKETFMLAYKLILLNVLFIVFYGYTAMTYYTLRAGGDSLRAFLIDQLPAYLVGIPLVMFLNYMEPTWGLGILLIFLISKSADLVKVYFSRKVIKKDTWLRNITIETPEPLLEIE